MMAGNRLGRFSLGILLFQLGCASAQRTTATDYGFRAELAADSVKNGAVLLVRIAAPAGIKDTDCGVMFEKSLIPCFPADYRGEGGFDAVVGIPHGHKPAEASAEVRVTLGGVDKNISLSFSIVDGKYGMEKLRVPPKYVEPSPDDQMRAEREKAEVGAVYALVTRNKYWNGPFVLPINSQATAIYGKSRIYNGTPLNYHTGVDLRADVGTPIYAPGSGVVRLAKELFYTGNTVIIDHGYGIITLYAHMSRIHVKKGERIKSGGMLGLAGMTGRVTGPHLHWQAVVHTVKVDPLELMKVMQ